MVKHGIDQRFRVIDMVFVQGTVRTAVLHPVSVIPLPHAREIGVFFFAQSLFCDRIINCSPYDMRTKNEFMIQGIVKSICVLNRECWRIVVATYVNNHYSVVPIILCNPDVRLYPQEVGEMIALRGFIETSRKIDTKTQKTVYIQNFVVK